MSEESEVMKRIAPELAELNKRMETLHGEVRGTNEAIVILSEQLKQTGEGLENELGNVATAGEQVTDGINAIQESLKAIAEGESNRARRCRGEVTVGTRRPPSEKAPEKDRDLVWLLKAIRDGASDEAAQIAEGLAEHVDDDGTPPTGLEACINVADVICRAQSSRRK